MFKFDNQGLLVGPFTTLVRRLAASKLMFDWKETGEYQSPTVRLIMFFSYPLRVALWCIFLMVPFSVIIVVPAIIETAILNLPILIWKKIRDVYRGEG